MQLAGKTRSVLSILCIYLTYIYIYCILYIYTEVELVVTGHFFPKIVPSHPGIEPGTFGLEVQCAILCANGIVLNKFRRPNFFFLSQSLNHTNFVSISLGHMCIAQQSSRSITPRSQILSNNCSTVFFFKEMANKFFNFFKHLISCFTGNASFTVKNLNFIHNDFGKSHTKILRLYGY